MLVLTRLLHQEIVITPPSGETIIVTVAEIANGRVKIGVTAPKEVVILRAELVPVNTEEANRETGH